MWKHEERCANTAHLCFSVVHKKFLRFQLATTLQ